jgi:hypothetical protein
MWDHPLSSGPGTRDVIGAWLVCLAIAVGCLGFLAPANPITGGGAPAALINPGPTATVAAAQNHHPGRC